MANFLNWLGYKFTDVVGNFRLPEEGELFDNVLIVGVTREEAEELIKKYNREGREARQRDDRTFNRNYGRDMERGYGRPMGGFRNRCKFVEW